MGRKNPNINDKGQEVLDPKPVVVFMEINEETGEVITEGRPRPQTLQQLVEGSADRNALMWDYGDEEDDDYDVEDDALYAGSIPDLSPHQEGFLEKYAPSTPDMIKALVKAGYSVTKPAGESEDEPPVAKKSSKGRAPQKAGEPEGDPASGGAPEPAED